MRTCVGGLVPPPPFTEELYNSVVMLSVALFVLLFDSFTHIVHLSVLVFWTGRSFWKEQTRDSLRKREMLG